MESSQDFNSLQEEIQKSLISTIKSANRIASHDLSFQRTVNPDVAEELDDKTSRILDLSTRLLNSAARACGLKPPKLEDPEDVDMNWRKVVDVVDSVLEKADRAIDEYTGLVKQRENGDSDSVSPLQLNHVEYSSNTTSPNKNSKPKQTKSTSKVIRNANVKKPQLDFEIKPNNFPDGPWKPLLTEKPHAEVSLDDSLVTFVGDNGAPQYVCINIIQRISLSSLTTLSFTLGLNTHMNQKYRVCSTPIEYSRSWTRYRLNQSSPPQPRG